MVWECTIYVWRSWQILSYFFDQTLRLLFFSLFILCRYCSRWHLFLWRAHRYQRWLDEVHTNATVAMLEAVSSKHSLSLLLSAVETTRTAQTVLALVWWLSSEIIHTCMHVLRLLFEAGVYSKKYGTLFFFNRIAMFKVLYCWTYIKCAAYNAFYSILGALDVHTLTKCP